MGATVADAARALAAGALVVYPTDTLWGLAARADDRSALDRLVAAKGRAPDQPISVAVSALDEVEPFAELSPWARGFLRGHLPGPYTVLVRPSARARRALAPAVASGPTIGFRVPDHPLARELARRAGPITATSANRHGAPPARSLAEARRTLGSAVAVYLAGGPAPTGRPSTLVDLTGPRARAVRRS
ncbi:MAG TPA: L-threonylcarbamoyladenylate synthase [Thermoplasmata archaeon]|nr:L-threonylcarbamoyladenylate synthase [Thermoplasmata archaeon]